MDPFYVAYAASGGDPEHGGWYPECDDARGELNGCPQPRGEGPVLVYTGAFDPWHDGHAHAVHAAMQRIRPSLVLVVPDADEYVRFKRPEGFTSLAQRCAEVERSVDGGLVHVSRSSAMFTRSPNFTTILLAAKRRYPDREIGLIVGQDNIRFAEVVAGVHGFFTVVVQRGDESLPQATPRTTHVPVADHLLRSMSSTTVRRDMATRTMYLKDDVPENPHLRREIGAFYRDLGMDVHTYRAPASPRTSARTVALDRDIRADVTLPVHRVFHADPLRQSAPLRRVVESPSHQIERDVEYLLVDDDCDTGGNLDTARRWIETHGGVVVGHRVALTLGPHEDALDLSDVSGRGGLLVQTPSGALRRVPYLPPFVDVTRRASVPDELVPTFREVVARSLR